MHKILVIYDTHKAVGFDLFNDLCATKIDESDSARVHVDHNIFILKQAKCFRID